MGIIKLYMGCMYSGKTSEIIRECKRQLSIGIKILCINYADDNRYGDDNFLYSHDMSKIDCTKVKLLADVNNELIKNAKCIMINEGQFFPDLLEYTLKWCEDSKYDKDIIISGLDGDYLRKPFGKLLEIIPLADYVYKFSALCVECKDGTEANFTHRLSGEKQQVVIGNKNYVPLCRKHYLELTAHK